MRKIIKNFYCILQSENEMNKSETIGKLAAALSKFQGECGSASKNKANPFFKSNYADLAGYIEVAAPFLSSNGLAVVQLMASHEETGRMTMETILTHSSGEFLSSVVLIPCNTNALTDPQKAGSAITYTRRYQYAAILGMAAADDDGNGAAKVANKPQPKQPFVFNQGWRECVQGWFQQGATVEKAIAEIEKSNQGFFVDESAKQEIINISNT